MVDSMSKEIIMKKTTFFSKRQFFTVYLEIINAAVTVGD
jgi:hypothetical protein